MTGVLCFFGLAPKKIIAWVLGFRIFGLWGWGTIFEAGPNRLQKKNTKPCDSHGERCQVARDDVFMSLFSYFFMMRPVTFGEFLGFSR